MKHYQQAVRMREREKEKEKEKKKEEEEREKREGGRERERERERETAQKISLLKSLKGEPSVVLHTFNPSTQEAEARG
jgi:hypothetical protein